MPNDVTQQPSSIMVAVLGIVCFNLSAVYLYLMAFRHPGQPWALILAIVALAILVMGTYYITVAYYSALKSPQGFIEQSIIVFGMAIAWVLYEMVQAGDQNGFLITIAGVSGAALVGTVISATDKKRRRQPGPL